MINYMNNMLTEQDHQLLSQFVDGELAPAAARELEQRLASEPLLSARLAQLQTLNKRHQSAFNEAQIGPVPGNITRLLEPAPVRVAFSRQPRATHWGYALAASLAIAVCGALLTQWDRSGDHAGAQIEQSLAEALEQLPSSGSDWAALADGRKVMPVLSFRSHSGDWCREYLVATTEAAWHGVACRAEQGWTNAVLAETKLVIGPGEYRPAGADEPDSVAAFIDQQSADIPLSAAEEAALIARSWQ